jgi:uncharacterized cupredoxin-like copper-binding protein
MPHRFSPLAMVLAALCAFAACGGGGAPPPPGSVQVDMKDFQFVLPSTSLNAGTATFFVRNAGPSAHDLTVIKTDKPADKLAYDGVKVTEPSLAGTAPLNPAQTATLAVNLTPGKYVFVCNQPGHYPLGMRIAVTVP